MKSNVKTTEEYLSALPDWQKKSLETFRKAIHDIVPDVKEEIKWGVPVFICKKKSLFAMAAFKEHTKYNFLFNGALIDDLAGLFNNGMESKKSRAIDLSQGQKVDSKALKSLILEAYRQL